ncbi:MAG: type II secretion system protein N [Gammaproteobacteria bacterium]|nr:type II secretion system protein N [Gammaproteobacteria bacterium]
MKIIKPLMIGLLGIWWVVSLLYWGVIILTKLEGTQRISHPLVLPDAPDSVVLTRLLQNHVPTQTSLPVVLTDNIKIHLLGIIASNSGESLALFEVSGQTKKTYKIGDILPSSSLKIIKIEKQKVSLRDTQDGKIVEKILAFVPTTSTNLYR